MVERERRRERVPGERARLLGVVGAARLAGRAPQEHRGDGVTARIAARIGVDLEEVHELDLEPVSSLASRTAAASSVSPSSTNPPGSAQPGGGSFRRTRTTRSPGRATTTSTVGEGPFGSGIGRDLAGRRVGVKRMRRAPGQRGATMSGEAPARAAGPSAGRAARGNAFSTRRRANGIAGAAPPGERARGRRRGPGVRDVAARHEVLGRREEPRRRVPPARLSSK